MRMPPGTEVADARRYLAYDRAKQYSNYGMVSNVFRYRLLYEEGGWWCDLDTVALKPFVFRQPIVFGNLMWDDYYACGVLRATPRWNVMGECIRRVDAEYGTKAEWNFTGPHLFTQVIKELGGRRFALPEKTFYPFRWDDCRGAYEGKAKDYPESHAIHFWHEWSSRQKVDLYGSFPAETLFETMHRRYPT
jgi:mannosyltransferase OCH1-like enzyme